MALGCSRSWEVNFCAKTRQRQRLILNLLFVDLEQCHDIKQKCRCCHIFVNAGFVYYEGDCFDTLKNPYVPVNVANPTLAQINQKKLVGEGMMERRKIIKDSDEIFYKYLDAEDYDIIKPGSGEESEKMEMYYKCFCEDIARERRRVGGDWVVAQAGLIDRAWRQFVRWVYTIHYSYNDR